MKKASTSRGTYKANFEELNEYLDAERAQGKTIVLTQGVFDLIHEGHARYLEMAKAHGDVLVVGIDSDELTRFRKGPTRPVVPETERVEMLTHLRHVDAVIRRDLKHDIGDLIRNVKPDILITSSSTKDFSPETAQEYQKYCKKIITLPPQSTSSTTARIRLLTIEGAEELAKEVNTLTREFVERIRNA